MPLIPECLVEAFRDFFLNARGWMRSEGDAVARVLVREGTCRV